MAVFQPQATYVDRIRALSVELPWLANRHSELGRIGPATPRTPPTLALTRSQQWQLDPDYRGNFMPLGNTRASEVGSAVPAHPSDIAVDAIEFLVPENDHGDGWFTRRSEVVFVEVLSPESFDPAPSLARAADRLYAVTFHGRELSGDDEVEEYAGEADTDGDMVETPNFVEVFSPTDRGTPIHIDTKNELNSATRSAWLNVLAGELAADQAREIRLRDQEPGEHYR